MNTQEKVNRILATPPMENKEDLINKRIQMIQLQLQELGDYIDGGITSYNMKEVRNTYVINAQDSLDDSYPFYVHFNIIGEMTKIVSVWMDFWIMNYRAYSTAAKSGGGSTSGSSSSSTTASGGSSSPTSENASHGHTHKIVVFDESPAGAAVYVTSNGLQADMGHGDILVPATGGESVTHTHEVDIPNHTHGMSHTHSTPDHTHDISYGIHEEDNSPAIKFAVSNNEGNSYSDIYGPFKENQSAIDITNDITGSGSKLVKFESTARSRLSVQITVKLDIKAR